MPSWAYPVKKTSVGAARQQALRGLEVLVRRSSYSLRYSPAKPLDDLALRLLGVDGLGLAGVARRLARTFSGRAGTWPCTPARRSRPAPASDAAGSGSRPRRNFLAAMAASPFCISSIAPLIARSRAVLSMKRSRWSGQALGRRRRWSAAAVSGVLVALVAHRVGGKEGFHAARLALVEAVQHRHQLDHALGAVARLDHVLGAEGVGLALVLAAVGRQQGARARRCRCRRRSDPSPGMAMSAMIESPPTRMLETWPLDICWAVWRMFTWPISCPSRAASSASSSSITQDAARAGDAPAREGVGVDVGRVHHAERVGHVRAVGHPAPGPGRPRSHRRSGRRPAPARSRSRTGAAACWRSIWISSCSDTVMNCVRPVTGLVAQPTAAPAAAMPVSAMKRRRVRPGARTTGIDPPLSSHRGLRRVPADSSRDNKRNA